MQPASNSYRFELHNSFADLARMGDWLSEALAEIALSEESSHAVRLCVIEAATNVISYAFPPGTEHSIDITLDVDRERLVATIADDGAPFDPLAHVAQALAPDLASVAIGGLGISLMRQFSNSMRYVRDGEINRLEMTFAR